MPLAAHVQGLSCKDHGGVSDPAPGQENCHRIQSSWFPAPCHHMSPPRAPTQLRLLPGKDAETTEVSFRGPISELPPDFSSRVEEGFQEKWGAFQLGSFSSHSWTPDILQQAPCCQRLPRDREWASQVIHGVDSSSPPEGDQRSTRSHTGLCRKASRPADKHTHRGLKYFYYLNYMLSHSIMCSSMHIVINITTF